ncbi:TlpA family protein disulfide reductase [Sphingobacterium bambusae]|uniref:TlpA family protein disulfide reductase n=1 Tax=Sphingobacterium bambusae TaxID=662858 RepID=A0ABW6BJS7_9SPHI|nr:TlpA disulfide reductase family protein [Sphingobacterium bambusae]WPL49414.1 TlpA disulfide reductase family protein [Sphingobacterium bambusae]
MKVTKKSTIKNYQYGVTAFISLMLSSLLCNGQSQASDLKALSIGDTVPYLAFAKAVNYSSPTLSTADFTDKAIILDFWATYCIPCIASFPKMEELQKKHEDKLKIILVSNDKEKAITSFYSRRSDLTLPTGLYQSGAAISKLFPYKVIPHYVWINKDGVIKAVTGHHEVTDKNIELFLAGKPLNEKMKNDELARGNYGGQAIDTLAYDPKWSSNSIALNEKFIYHSSLMRYDPRLTGMGIEGLDTLQYRYRLMQNYSAAFLMQEALGLTTRTSVKMYMDLDNWGLNSISPKATQAERESWQKKYAYTYRIIIEHQDSSKFHEIMLRDIEYALGLRTYNKTIVVPKLILSRVGSTKNPISKGAAPIYTHSIYHIEMQNTPISKLVDVLDRYHVGENLKLKNQRRLSIEDRTGITDHVDISLREINLGDLEVINAALKKYDLKLSLVEEPMEMIVVTDKPKP